MLSPEKAGVSYSINIDSGNSGEILIKALFGLGEALVSSNIFPDVYTVEKTSLEIRNIEVNDKEFEFSLDNEVQETRKFFLKEKGKEQVLNGNEIVELARITKRISVLLGKEVCIEWAIKARDISILQIKEIVMKEAKKEKVELEIYDEAEDAPEVIDICDDQDIEEDLKVLEEIERQESSPEEIREGLNRAEEIFIKLNKPSEPRKEEESIFTSLNKKDDEPRKILEKAFFNSGNIIVACDMAIITKLKMIYRKKFGSETKSFQELTEKLRDTIGDYLDDIRRIHELRTDFLEGIIEPSSRDVELAMRTAKEFVESS